MKRLATILMTLTLLATLRGGAGGNDGSGGVRCGVYDGNADAD